MRDGIDPTAVPSGTGCRECMATGGWWVHLRRCAECGHIGCCDTSPSQHATYHHHVTGHSVIRSFEPGEEPGLLRGLLRSPFAAYGLRAANSEGWLKISCVSRIAAEA